MSRFVFWGGQKKTKALVLWGQESDIKVVCWGVVTALLESFMCCFSLNVFICVVKSLLLLGLPGLFASFG